MKRQRITEGSKLEREAKRERLQELVSWRSTVTPEVKAQRWGPFCHFTWWLTFHRKQSLGEKRSRDQKSAPIDETEMKYPKRSRELQVTSFSPKKKEGKKRERRNFKWVSSLVSVLCPRKTKGTGSSGKDGDSAQGRNRTGTCRRSLYFLVCKSQRPEEKEGHGWKRRRGKKWV